MKKRTPSILSWFAEVKPKFFDFLKSHVRQKTESFTAGLGSEIDEMVGQISCGLHTFSWLVMFEPSLQGMDGRALRMLVETYR